MQISKLMEELEKIKQEIENYRAKPLLTETEKKILDWIIEILNKWNKLEDRSPIF